MRVWAAVWAVICVVLVLSACSVERETRPAAEPAPTVETCPDTATAVVERFDAFVAPFADSTPADFLGGGEPIEGLEEFRNEVFALISNEQSCDVATFEALVDEELSQRRGDGLLVDFLIDSIRFGGEPQRLDVQLGPDDDLNSVLGLLDDGSTVTLEPGSYQLDGSLIVQAGLTIVGAGSDQTVLETDAADAAIAVFGGAAFDMRALRLRSSGDVPAAGVLGFSSNITLVDVAVSGFTADADGVGGAGVLITSDAVLDADGNAIETGAIETGATETGVIEPGAVETEAAASDGEGGRLVIDGGRFEDNVVGGIAVSGDIDLQLTGAVVANNGSCGICFFGSARGVVTETVIEGNAIGVQISDSASPDIVDTELRGNVVAGLVTEADGGVDLQRNRIDGNGEVGIDLRGRGPTVLADNIYGAQSVGLSIRDAATPVVSAERFEGSEIGVLVGDQAQTELGDLLVTETTAAAVVVEGEATADLVGATITLVEGAGVVTRAGGAIDLRSSSISGGEVGIAGEDTSQLMVEDVRVDAADFGLDIQGAAVLTARGIEIRDAITVGAVFSGTSSGEVDSLNVVDAVTIGLQVGGSANPEITSSSVNGAQTAILVIEEATPTITDSDVVESTFGIGVSDDAAPMISSNRIRAGSEAVVTYQNRSGGSFVDNEIVDVALIGIRALDEAAPSVSGNLIAAILPESEEDLGTVGLLFEADSAGSIDGNDVFGFSIGAQLSGSTRVDLENNVFDGAAIGVVGLLYDGSAGGNASRNTVRGNQIGVQLVGSTVAWLEANVIESAFAASFLVDGEATPVLQANECAPIVVGIAIAAGTPVLDDNDCQIQRQ
ncbi:MAG: right-handed parallel beta-helix repeat-containing protein [Actinomycetota bacterium]